MGEDCRHPSHTRRFDLLTEDMRIQSNTNLMAHSCEWKQQHRNPTKQKHAPTSSHGCGTSHLSRRYAWTTQQISTLLAHIASSRSGPQGTEWLHRMPLPLPYQARQRALNWSCKTVASGGNSFVTPSWAQVMFLGMPTGFRSLTPTRYYSRIRTCRAT